MKNTKRKLKESFASLKKPKKNLCSPLVPTVKIPPKNPNYIVIHAEIHYLTASSQDTTSSVPT